MVDSVLKTKKPAKAKPKNWKGPPLANKPKKPAKPKRYGLSAKPEKGDLKPLGKLVKPVKKIKEQYKLKKPIQVKIPKSKPSDDRWKVIATTFKLQSPREETRWQRREYHTWETKGDLKKSLPVYTRRIPILLDEKTWRRLEKEAAKASNQAGVRPTIPEVAAALLIYALDERGVTLPKLERKK